MRIQPFRSVALHSIVDKQRDENGIQTTGAPLLETVHLTGALVPGVLNMEIWPIKQFTGNSACEHSGKIRLACEYELLNYADASCLEIILTC